MVTWLNGSIWVPDFTGCSQADMQNMVRGFLTSHYHTSTSYISNHHLQGYLFPGLICKNPKISAPFKKLAKFQNDLFQPEHIPDGFIFLDDPSHLKANDAKWFLEFIRKQQLDVPDDVFQFQYWLDGKNELQEPAESNDEGLTEVKWQQISCQEGSRVKELSGAPIKGQENSGQDESTSGEEDSVWHDLSSPSIPYSDWSESKQEAGDLPQKMVSFKVVAPTHSMTSEVHFRPFI